MKSKLIILRGCPGAGKSPLARELARSLKGKIAKLTLDEFQWEMTAHKKRTKRDFEISFNNYLTLVENYLKNKYNVIAEDVWVQHYGYPDKSTDVNKVIKLGKKYHAKIYLFLLRSEFATIKKKNPTHRAMEEKELRDIYDKIYSMNLEGEFILKVDGKSNEQIAKEILELIK